MPESPSPPTIEPGGALALKLRKVRCEKKGRIACVTIENAEKENCLTEEVDHPRLFVAVLTGAGRKSFCAGSDLGRSVETVSKRSPEWNRRRVLEGPNLGGITKERASAASG